MRFHRSGLAATRYCTIYLIHLRSFPAQQFPGFSRSGKYAFSTRIPFVKKSRRAISGYCRNGPVGNSAQKFFDGQFEKRRFRSDRCKTAILTSRSTRIEPELVQTSERSCRVKAANSQVNEPNLFDYDTLLTGNTGVWASVIRVRA